MRILAASLVSLSLLGLACSSSTTASGSAESAASVSTETKTATATPRVAQSPAEYVEEHSLESSQISPVVKARYGAVSGCHSLSYAGGTQKEGKITLAWTVSKNGTVKTASVVNSSIANSEVEGCVIDIAKSLKFPEATATTDVQWTFSFSSSSRSSSVASAR